MAPSPFHGPDARAFTHDMGMTQGSGLTSWTVDPNWAMKQQQAAGGVVIKATAPEGSVYFNTAAKGAESQVLVPGKVTGEVVVGK